MLGVCIVALASFACGVAPRSGGSSAPAQTVSTATPEPNYDVPYVPTPTAVVAEMLRMADVGKNDVIYDLGSGDGRIVITAAKERGARGVGIDINPARIKEANGNARAAGVSERVEFREQNLFDADLSEATVVTLYLLPAINAKLRPKLLRELKPGTRIVSHEFGIGDWESERTVDVDGSLVHLWTIPARTTP